MLLELEPFKRRDVRGQYDENDAKLYFKAAKFFPQVTVRKIGVGGNMCHTIGGSFAVSDGYIALEFSGKSDDDPSSPFKSFYKKFEELEKKQQSTILSKINR